MMRSAGSSLSDLFASINLYSSEEDVENKVILPLLSLLGYNGEDWKAQFILGKYKLDFLIKPKDSGLPYPPYLVIEAKAARKKISQNRWQINNYMRKSGAILGLLTNGYQFRLFYQYDGKIETVAQYSQTQLIAEFNRFYKLLCKATCLKIYYALTQRQQQVYSQFGNLISKAFANEDMLGLFRKKSNPSVGKDANQVDSILVEPENALLVNKVINRNSMIITVFNNKGGVGKTTTTINLAAALSKMGKRVLLIDIDGQANLTTGLGIDPLIDVEDQGKKDITHLLTEPRTRLEDTIIKKRWQNIELHLVPSHIRLSRMENVLNTTVGIDQVLEKKLKNNDYDFVFIDPPPSFGRVNGISLMASSGILIPTQLSAYPIRALEYVLDRINEIEQLKPLPILGIAVSMYDQRSSSFNSSMTEKLFDVLEKSGGADKVELFPENTWIPRLNVLSISQDKGYPLYQAEFDDQLSSKDKEAAQKALERYEDLAEHLIKVSKERLSNNG